MQLNTAAVASDYINDCVRVVTGTFHEVNILLVHQYPSVIPVAAARPRGV
jgi:hypothetical protein